MNKRERSTILAICILIFLTFSLCFSQNFVVIGSEDAPIRYIRGTGSNIGIMAGVELLIPPSINGSLKKPFGEIGVARYYRRDQIKGGGQGMRKQHCIAPDLDIMQNFSCSLLNPNISFNTTNRMVSIRHTISKNEDNFQLLPFYNYDLTAGEINDIFLPLLCLDQNLPVESNINNSIFEISPCPTLVEQTYQGIYRFDQYINEKLISKVWYKDGQFSWYENTLTDAEIAMMIFCVAEIDSTSLYKDPIGYYKITKAYLYPGFAQWIIWAASHNQDEQAFLDGYNYIRKEYHNLAPVTFDDISDFLNLTHILFYFGELNENKVRFRAPAGTAQLVIPNLQPYAFIKANQKTFAQMNLIDGIDFQGHYSFDPDGTLKKYEWIVGSTILSNEDMDIKVKFRDSASTLQPVILKVTDNKGKSSTDTMFVPFKNVEFFTRTSHFKSGKIIQDYSLVQNYPNPFNSSTSIHYSCQQPTQVDINIYNECGQKIRSLVSQHVQSGQYSVQWDGQNDAGGLVPSGLYLCRMIAGEYAKVIKMVMLQ